MSTYLAAEDLSMFGRDPWCWSSSRRCFCFAFLMVTVLVLHRLGGSGRRLDAAAGSSPTGTALGHAPVAADGVKLMLKEDIIVKARGQGGLASSRRSSRAIPASMARSR
ncbi:hypothetical protein GCM10017687_37400 [Streptomyces echinatus]|uniref:hypothetical protein n=1 Tax=Streptomyces echinatus TaxID=67293 RepID=UPI00337095F6